jgi:phosphate:Na+ symporter
MTVDWFELAYTVVGGLCVFLFGMKALSESLQALASDFIRHVIGWLTTNRLLAVAVGAVVTLIVQSSSVTTVMVVGFVNAGLMSLLQAVGVILGANIGTTITGWIVALKVGKYGLAFLALGLLPFFFVQNAKWKNSGKISIALGFIFLGLEFMSGGFKPLTRDPTFGASMVFFSGDTLGSVLACVAVGCLLTFVVQSSSAMLAITIALATTGTAENPPVIGLTTAVALVLGENIGTTITAQLAAIGGNISAKRAAMAHTLFNVMGVTVVVLSFRPFMFAVEHFIGPLFDSLSHVFTTSTGDESYAIIGFQIAAAHSLFNVTSAVLFTPFIPQLARLTERLRPDAGLRQKKRLKLLGDVSQVSPELALQQAQGEVRLCCDVTRNLFDLVARFLELGGQEPDLATEIRHAEQVTDNIQKEVTIFLTTILQAEVTQAQASRAYSLLRLADEVESVADYLESLANYRARLTDHGESLSAAAREDLKSLFQDTCKLFEIAAERSTTSHDKVDIEDLLALGNAQRDHADAIRSAHLERVQQGSCDALAGLTFSDMVVAMRRIKNHSINMVEAHNSSWQSRLKALEVLDVAEVRGAKRG